MAPLNNITYKGYCVEAAALLRAGFDLALEASASWLVIAAVVTKMKIQPKQSSKKNDTRSHKLEDEFKVGVKLT
ncbi:hypothetical protein J6590_071632 [Homalodisca vitripennis]|nr:hypothetical protein J6590_071632 [Homalodisca vitripennis]